MRIKLSDNFNYNRLFRFVLPSIIMMLFTSIYSVVDGLFVSNFVGKTPFAAVNIIMPVLMILGAFGFMIGTGGSAIVAKTLGEGKQNKANQYFSMLIYVVIIAGLIITVVGMFLIPYLSKALGADGEMLKNCVIYGRVMLLGITSFMLQNTLQSFFITAEKPNLGLATTVISGVTNMLLDALFVAVFKWGLFGAAFATVISQTIGASIGFIYFATKNDSILRFVFKTKFNFEVLLKSCTNGSSEMVSTTATSLISMLYNFQLMSIAGENGIAAYGVIMYVSFIFQGIFYGYAMGSAPIISYNYGADNIKELKNIFKKSIVITFIAGILMALFGNIASKTLSNIFVGYDIELFEMTVHAFKVYSLSFLFSGFGIFGSSFFTALNDGKVSAIISFLRTFLFEIGSIIILPFIFGIEGIWSAIIAAEFAAFIVTFVFIISKREKYKYA